MGRVREGDVPPPARSAENVNSAGVLKCMKKLRVFLLMPHFVYYVIGGKGELQPPPPPPPLRPPV